MFPGQLEVNASIKTPQTANWYRNLSHIWIAHFYLPTMNVSENHDVMNRDGRQAIESTRTMIPKLHHSSQKQNVEALVKDVV